MKMKGLKVSFCTRNKELCVSNRCAENNSILIRTDINVPDIPYRNPASK